MSALRRGSTPTSRSARHAWSCTPSGVTGPPSLRCTAQRAPRCRAGCTAACWRSRRARPSFTPRPTQSTRCGREGAGVNE
eukprot:351159-Chlamydomonas_euryale.AAC.12